MPRPAPEPAGEPLPLRAHGALRKRWRWVGIFAPEAMACVALAEVGGVPRGWWAVLDRRTGAVREEDLRVRPGRRIDLAAGSARVRAADGAAIDLRLDEEAVEPVTCRCPHGRPGGWTWTRKRAGVPARGRIALPGAAPIELSIDAFAVVDDTLGYHAHRTRWQWAAGVGRAADGRGVAWNLVAGVNDPPSGSERAVWVEGEAAREPAPASFSRDLTRVTTADGIDLRAEVEAVRAHREGLGPLRSHYRQPFARVRGELGAGVVLAEGLGVLEDHEARW